MRHPFINDLSNKNMEELQDTITKLNSKLNFAYRMQNSAMIQQLNMIIDSYKSEYNKRMDALYKKQNLDNRINITKQNDSKNT
jgi:ribosomal protein L29